MKIKGIQDINPKLPPYHYIMRFAEITLHETDSYKQPVRDFVKEFKGKEIPPREQASLVPMLSVRLTTEVLYRIGCATENPDLKLVEIDKRLIPIFEATDNEIFYRPLFFPYLFINNDLTFGDFLIKGILVIDEITGGKLSVLDTKSPDGRVVKDWLFLAQCLNFKKDYSMLVVGELIHTETMAEYYGGEEVTEEAQKLKKYLRNLLCNIVDFVEGNAEDDMQIVKIETSPEHNKKRMAKNKIAIPTRVIIRPKNAFLNYVNQFNSDHQKLSYRYQVRGHWRRFRHERYSPARRDKPKWIKPFFKGEGILLNRNYLIKE